MTRSGVVLAVGLLAGSWIGIANAQDTPVQVRPSLDLQFEAQSSYIFRLRDDVPAGAVRSRAAALAQEGGGTLRHVFTAGVKGFSANMSDVAATQLMRRHPEIIGLERNGIARIDKPGKGKGPGNGGGGNGDDGGSSQTIPWGITRVLGTVMVDGVETTDLQDGRFATIGRRAWVIDTGIDLDHPDLNVDVIRSAAFGSGNPDDQHGHGTHVAGTIGAVDNEIQVVGVAAGASVVAVRVLGRRGTGTTDDTIAGVQHVYQNASGGDVANMSLSVSPPSDTLEDLIRATATDKNVRFALAAGNSSLFSPPKDASTVSPARVNHANVYTVSAIDSNDVYAFFSNFGNPPIDYTGPGVDVLSLWKKGGTNTISGTSMATPHVAGVLLLRDLGSEPGCDGNAVDDPDGTADPIVHNSLNSSIDQDTLVCTTPGA